MDKDLRVIVGLGKTGLSCVRYFQRQGIAVAVVDSRDNPPALAALQQDYPDVPVYLGQLDQPILNQAREIILSPGVAKAEPAIVAAMNQGIEVVGDIEVFARVAKAPVIAITGSNGKGTVTTLVGDMAREQGLKVIVAGNIGEPVLDQLEQGQPDLYVLELSSFQLETTYSLVSKVGVILNISPDHMDRYPDMAAYIAAKHRIFNSCDSLVVNRDDPNTQPRQFTSRPVISFGFSEPGAGEFGIRMRDDQAWLARGADYLLPVTALRIKGRHNWANALAALALGHVCEFDEIAMLRALQNFRGLPHRCEWLGEYAGLNWVNDSKATNIGATWAAISGLAQPGVDIVLIAGGVGKSQDFKELRPVLQDHVQKIILFGEDAAEMAEAFDGTASLSQVGDLAAAVHKAQEIARLGSTVLFAPACASFDMYKNFEARGQHFMQLVQGLMQNA